MALTLEAALAQHWATWRPLAALVGAERIWTGTAAEGAAPPYVVIQRGPGRLVLSTSSGTKVERLAIVFQVYSRHLEPAERIARRIGCRFDRAALELDEGAVLDMRRWGCERQMLRPDLWRLAVAYEATVSTSGAITDG